jgi:hypothetical protein
MTNDYGLPTLSLASGGRFRRVAPRYVRRLLEGIPKPEASQPSVCG